MGFSLPCYGGGYVFSWDQGSRCFARSSNIFMQTSCRGSSWISSGCKATQRGGLIGSSWLNTSWQNTEVTCWAGRVLEWKKNKIFSNSTYIFCLRIEGSFSRPILTRPKNDNYYISIDMQRCCWPCQVNPSKPIRNRNSRHTWGFQVLGLPWDSKYYCGCTTFHQHTSCSDS